MLVQAIDNKFYKNPSIYGDNCFIKFLDVDDTRFIIAITERVGIKAQSYEQLAKMNVKGKLTAVMDTSLCCVPPDWSITRRSMVFGFIPRDKIPIPDKYEAIVDRPAVYDDFFAMDMDFTKDEIDKLLVEQKPTPLLLKFIYGRQIWDDLDENEMRGLIRRVKSRMKKEGSLINNHTIRLKKKIVN